MTSPTLTSVPVAPLVRGAAELERTPRGLLPHRLPAWARAQCADPQLATVESQPSGVRLVLRTAATVLEVDTYRRRVVYAGVPPRPDGVVDLVVDGVLTASATTSGGTTVTVDMRTGAAHEEAGEVCTSRFEGLPGGTKDVEVWLPHIETTELVDLRADAPVAPGPTGDRAVWLHHGSSVSHGSNAARPTGTWPAVASRTADVELVNLGLGGSALLDPFVARTLRDAPADVISVKIGINLVNADLMRVRAFGPAVHGFLDTIRDGHPETPLLVVSPIFCGIHEDTPGPGAFDTDALAEGVVRFRATGDPGEVVAGKLTLTVIRAELERIVRERQPSDPNLHHLDGRELYGPDDAQPHPLPDALHPDAATHQIIGERFARLALGEGGPLTVRR
ncbi:SGNH/GDSL hydrolase family protein [Sanguibacter suaedae]|uniref:Lipase n=1 Tax=Sanguibacter suaedae TaxID=2795737 RepID=A0A934IDF0_9MICO|nr:SGNH/GDSL hydrolase family protein [Sanguibacter suaedae]MBI9115791.1 lipase [Sanguibacter suaedae]